MYIYTFTLMKIKIFIFLIFNWMIKNLNKGLCFKTIYEMWRINLISKSKFNYIPSK